MCVYVCVCNTEGFYPRKITDGCDLTRMHECVQCMCACLQRIDAAMCDSEVCCVSAVKRTQEPHDSASVCVFVCALLSLRGFTSNLENKGFFLKVKIPFEKSENIKARTCSEK